MKDLFKLDFSNIRGDFLGGLTAGIVALPLALAFGDQTALGAMSGLYGAIALAVLAAIFGGTATQISGPTAPMTVVSATIIVSALTLSGADSVEAALPVILATFFLAGLIEMLFGFARLGRYIRYIPYPVVSGFMSGIGVIIIITQIFPLLGYNAQNDAEFVEERLPVAREHLMENMLIEELERGEIKGYMAEEDLEAALGQMRDFSMEDIRAEATTIAAQDAGGTVGTIKYLTRPFTTSSINWINLLVGLLTIIIIYGFKRITRVLPSSLVALIVMSIVSYFAFQGQIPVIGQVESGLPKLQLGLLTAFTDLSLIGLILKFALTLAALGAIDSLLTSVVADNMTKTRHDPNQELIGQGIGNMGSALIGGLPGAGATMRTVINIQSGGKTKISGVIAGIFLLAVLLGLGAVVQYIPKAVLAGILMTVGIGIIDYKAFRHMRAMPRSEVVIMLVVLLLTVFVDLLTAVGVGMVMAALSFMITTGRIVEEGVSTSSTVLTDFAREKPWEDEGDFVSTYGSQVYIKHLDGALFFGFSNRFQEMIQALPDLKVVIMRMGRMNYVDQSGLYAMEEAIQDLQRRGVAVLFTGLGGQPLDMFRSIQLIPSLVPEFHSFETFTDCRHWLVQYLDEHGGLDGLAQVQIDHEADVDPEMADEM